MRHRVLAPAVVTLMVLASCSDQKVTRHNASPFAAITSHTEAEEVEEGATVTFHGGVSDPDHAAKDLEVIWYVEDTVACPTTSPADDGQTECTVVIGAADFELRLEVRDPEGAAGSTELNLVVIPTEAPEAEILAPTADGTYYSDAKITFEGVVSDAEDPAESLQAWWESDLDGTLEVEAAPNSDGEVLGFGYLSEGEHALTLHVEDATGKTGTDSVILQVGPSNSPPTCTITVPESGSVGELGESVSFEAEVADADVSADWLTVTWSSDKDGELGSSTPNTAGEVGFATSALSANTHTITLTVKDEIGGTCSDFITYIVGSPPTLDWTSPTDSVLVNEGDALAFAGQVSDDRDSVTELALSWVSSLDGTFSNQGADSTGLAQFSTAALSAGTHAITVTVTDTDGMFTQETRSVIVNALPSQPGVSLSPNPVRTADDLSVSIDTPSIDPDGDAVTYTYAWYQDGALVGASTSAVLSASETARGETWRVVVTPSDGMGDGPPGEAEVTIDNTPPVLASVTLSPDPAYDDETLTCTPGTTTDADGTTSFSYAYAWFVDDEAVVETSSSLTPSWFEADQVVYCEVTPNDGIDDGEPVASNVVTILAEEGEECPTDNTGSLAFDGVDDHVELASIEGLDEDGFTVEAWVYYEGTADISQSLFAYRAATPWYDDAFTLRIQSSSTEVLDFGYADGSGDSDSWGISGATAIPTDTWTHVAATYDRTTNDLAVYVNGVLDGEGTAPYEGAIGDYPLWLGADPYHGSTGRTFGGLLDEVRIWGLVRSEEEIAANMSCMLTGEEEGLLLYWPMEAGSGQVLSDWTDNGGDGQLGNSNSSDDEDPTWSSELPFE
jgi:hypothetical protein